MPINGSLGGIGNVIEHGSISRTHVHIQDGGFPPSLRLAPQAVKWARLAAFPLTLAGPLTAIVFFLRLLQSLEAFRHYQIADAGRTALDLLNVVA